MIAVRPARPEDEEPLSVIDAATWTTSSSIAPPPPEPTSFFAHAPLAEVLVAELDGTVAGYVRLAHPTPFPSSRHVLQIRGLGVDPALQRRGVGRALVEGALAHARERGIRRVTLRVLATNDRARALYASCGFEVEGVLRGEFRLDGRDVDDVLMACTSA
jgi:ribosomal protein S18 acetylase RimI-like enzyme